MLGKSIVTAALGLMTGVCLVMPQHAANANSSEDQQNGGADTSIVLKSPGEDALPRREARPRSLQRWAARIGDSYPTLSLLLNQYGSTQFATRVTTRGRATDCEVVRSSGFSYLDERTCRAIERYSRFNEALDEAGNPVEASYTNTIVWRIDNPDSSSFYYENLGLEYPTAALDAGLAGTTEVEITVGPGERITSCYVLKSSGHPILDEATCEGLRKVEAGERVASAYRGPKIRTLPRSIRWELPVEEEDEDLDDY